MNSAHNLLGPRRLMRAGCMAWVGTVGLLVLSAPASAQTFEQIQHPQLRESPRRLAFELKFGPYVPAVDSSPVFAGRNPPATPFSDFFGSNDERAGVTPSRGLLTQGEVDYQFLNRFGSLGVGLSGGYYSRSAPAFTSYTTGTGQERPVCTLGASLEGWRTYRSSQPPGNQVSYESCISGDQVVFNLVPVSLLLVYRFDELSKRFRIPIIPYMKAGFGAYFWWIGSSASFVSSINTTQADGMVLSRSTAGATYGLVIHPGLAIDLSAIDQQASRVIDNEIGLNRVSLFVELHGAFMSGWGQGNKLDLSDMTFNAGINFEF